MKRNAVLAISALVFSLLVWRWWAAARPADRPEAHAARNAVIQAERPAPARRQRDPSRADPASPREGASGRATTAQSVPAGTSLAAEPPLRAPIIQAIRAAGQTAHEKRESMLQAIEASGASQEPWTQHAQRSFDAWRGAMPESAQRALRVGPIACFRAGCVVEVSFASEAAYQEAARAFRTIGERESAHGGRVQTPAEARSGKIVANWIMLRPEMVREEDDA